MAPPAGVPSANCRVWVWVPDLTGLSNNDTPATLTDQSGNGNNLASGTGTGTYKTNVINGLPVVEFNGTNSQYRTSYSSAAERITYFHVFRHLKVPPTSPGDFCITSGESGGANKVMLGMTVNGSPCYLIEQSGTGGAAHQYFGFGILDTSTWRVHRQRYDVTDRGWENGSELVDGDLPSSAAGSNSSIGVKVGSREDDTRYWNGQLVGFGVFQGLTDQQETDVEAELISRLANSATVGVHIHRQRRVRVR